jgi:protease-4
LSADKQNNRSVVGLMAMVAVFFVVLVIFAIYTVQIFKGSDEKSAFGLKTDLSKSVIGVVEVNGTIMKSKDIIELIHQAHEDKDIKALILRINSPGGAVGPTQEIYYEIRRLNNLYDTSKGKKGLPIYASFSTIAASGGYYLGAATREIWTMPGTLTGSIGVIMQFMDLSKVFELVKVRPEIVKAGRYKDIGQPSRSMTEEERALMSDMIKGVHKQFISDIHKTRKDKIKKKNITELAQGQIFSGEQAVDYGLADKIGSVWEASREIHKKLKFKGKVNLKFIKKKKDTGFLNFIKNIDKVSTNINEILSNSDFPKLMYK